MSDLPGSASTPHGAFRRFVERRVRILTFALPAACLLLLLPVDGWLFELLRHFRIWCACIGLGLCAMSFALRRWCWAVVALLTGLWQAVPLAVYQVRPGGSPVQPGSAFSILTCNLQWEANDPDAMMASLRKADADVLVLLEFTAEWQAIFGRGMWEQYPHRVEVPEEGAFGICLASRLPLEGAAKVTDSAGFVTVTGTVTAGKERIALLGVHPLPPVRPAMFAEWRESFASWPAMLLRSGAPHQVLAGDFNCTPFTRSFAKLCEETGLRDSARGFGLWNTWYPFGPPFGLPIDHVLVSKDLWVESRDVGPPAGSDHRWVSVTLRMPWR
jgi:endonuclease/exonuclease/phosphatase (EEP) superfamily protein YafD